MIFSCAGSQVLGGLDGHKRGESNPDPPEGYDGWARWMHATLTPGILGAALCHDRDGSVETLTDDVRIERLMDGMLGNVALARLDGEGPPTVETDRPRSRASATTPYP